MSDTITIRRVPDQLTPDEWRTSAEAARALLGRHTHVTRLMLAYADAMEGQAHEWIDDTNYADHGHRYVCATCGATRTEPRVVAQEGEVGR